MSRSDDFDLADLYDALDEKRVERGLSWPGAIAAINAQFADVPSLPISRRTVMGLRTARTIEGDGALQMLRWLGRAPESFVAGYPAAALPAAALPDLKRNQILRFDTVRLHAALNATRVERGLSWAQAASQIGGATAAMLTNLAQGGRTGFPFVIRATAWLGQPVVVFTRAADR